MSGQRHEQSVGEQSPGGPAGIDPRPHVVSDGDPGIGSYVEGRRCSECRYPTFHPAIRCAVCGGSMEPDRYGPAGTVFSATVVRIAIPGRVPPYGLAYVDLDDGPRILGHVTESESALQPGDRVQLVGATEAGDPLVRLLGMGAAG